MVPAPIRSQAAQLAPDADSTLGLVLSGEPDNQLGKSVIERRPSR